jgi:thioredoxin-like negative regulator of GroEL
MRYKMEKFLEYVKNKTDKTITICKVGADWCMPCKQIDKILAEIKKEKVNYCVISLDVDIHQNILPTDIGSIPTTYIIVDGVIKETINGLISKNKLIERIYRYEK